VVNAASWRRDFVTVVSGLPRSGTSLMMQMLGAGGVPLLVDTARPPDVDNPRGYFEYGPVKQSARDLAWFEEAPGRAVKVIHALLPRLPDAAELRILFMQRDLTEVLRSQGRLMERSGTPIRAGEDERIAELLAAQLRDVLEWAAARPLTALLVVPHRELFECPARMSARIDAFLGGGLDLEAMGRAVDPSLYRNRALS
jgi:hypothetical protein